MKDTGFKTRLGQITKIKSQSGEPIEFESGQVIINKVSTKKNLKKLVDINNDTSKKTSVKVTDDATVGGLLEGPPHYDKKGNDVGGIPGIVDGNKQIEVEGQEFVVNKEASKKHWRELSKINQSAGNGVPIGPPTDYDEDPKEYKEGGRVIDFNPNHIPSKKILNYAKKIKQYHPEIWKLGGNIFGNKAFENLKRVSERGYWLDSEEWMYIKWRSYVARHIHDFTIEGVIAMLKWVDKVERGWPYMKNLIEQEIAKREGKESDKMAKGGVITYKHKYNKKYGYEKNQSHDLEQISKDTGVSLEGLQEIYNKGIGAYKTNPESVRPNVKSKEQWAMARVYSAVMGGKASKIDANELKMNKGGDLNAIVLQYPYNKTGEFIEGIAKDNISEIYNNVSFRKFGNAFRKNIDSNFSQEYNLESVVSLSISWKELSSYIIGDGSYSVNEEQYKNFINNFNTTYKDNYEKGGLIAPNGKQSNLTPKQYKLVRTPEFKAWFGDWDNDPNNSSKVVDENGEPLVVYHGTKNKFYTFDKRARGSNTDPGIFGKGFYFSKNLQTSKNYGNYIIETFLNIRNPFNNSEFKNKSELAEYLDISEDILTQGGTGIKAYTSFTGIFSDAIKEKGHDGVTTRFGEIVVFEPEQIKLADGSNSTFDKNNPDIRFENGGGVGRDANELSEILMEHLNDYCKYHYNDELDKDSFMMKTIKGQNGHQVKELSGTTKKGIDVHISIEELYMKRGGNVDAKDTITLDVPLMIRLLELSKEDIKSDAELHFLVEKLIELKNKPVLTMDDYAFIADLEHNHLKKFDLGGKVNPGQREVDLGFGGLGNGTTVWDRNRIENNDYKIVAHISNSGNVTYYDKNLPEDAKNKIEEMAMKEKQDLENQNGLSSGYEFMPINTPLN